MDPRLIVVAPILMAAVSCLGNQSRAESSSTSTAPGTSAPAVAAIPAASTDTARALTLPDFATLAAKIVPAVVKIEVQQQVKLSEGRRRRGPSPFGADPFEFFFPFGPQRPHDFENRGLGSGFFIEERGLVLTNMHVVENADEIRVTFRQPEGAEKTLGAKLLGRAPDYDVALLQTDERPGAPVIPLGDSDRVRIGEWVMAVGNPFGLDHSVSVGIISAKERRDIAPSGRQGLYNFLQTDASINPGNSGGPLINIGGEVIGINSAINAAGQGIGFAIPINMVKTMLPQLEKGGSFGRSWLGVRIQSLTPELAQSYGLEDARGVLVAEVLANSPAATAGLREGDVILEFDGKRLNRSSDLSLYVSMAGVDQSVPLVVFRDGKKRTFKVKLAAYPEDEARLAAAQSGGGDREASDLGFTMTELSPDLREHIGVETERGALVEEVEPGSIAARGGLQPGDVIVGVNGETVSSPVEVRQKLSRSKSGAIVRFKIERRGGGLFLALKKP